MYLLRQDSGRAVTPYGQARQQTELMEPDTEQVVNAYIGEATSGVGTLNADISAYGVKKAEEAGTPLTKEQYQQSPFYRAAIPYYRGMTEKSAEQLSIYSDESEKRAEFISDATAWQTARGYAAAFGFGMVEPKNIATGLATSFLLTPLAGAAGPAAASVRRLMKMRQEAGQWGGKVALGAIEGGVSAAMAEPSNQYSASILRQDYTMADSAWNIALSTAFGVGASVAGIGATDVPKIVRDKWEKHGARTPDVIAAELDTAVSQLAQGKRVDVSPVEAALATKAPAPVSTPLSPVLEDPFSVEIKARPLPADNYTKGLSEYSKVMYRQAHPSSALEVMPYGNIATDVPELFLADNLDFATGQGKNKDGVMLAFDTTNLKGRINTNKPAWQATYEQGMAEFVGRYNKQSDYQKSLVAVRVPADLQLSKTDSMMFNRTLGALEKAGWSKVEGDGFVEYRKPSEAAPRSTAENSASLQKSLLDDASPDNDTAIDAAAWEQLDDMESDLMTDADKLALQNWENDMKEISAMKREGLLSAEDETAMLDALNSVNEKEISAAWDDLYACLTRG